VFAYANPEKHNFVSNRRWPTSQESTAYRVALADQPVFG
jgi:hypothetical protein